VPSVTLPFTITLFTPNPEHSRARFAGRLTYLPGPRGLFLTKPPYGRMTAIDVTTGEQRWVVPVGDGPHCHPTLKAFQLSPLGWPFRTHTLLTNTLLFDGQQGSTSEFDTPSGDSPLSLTWRPSIPNCGRSTRPPARSWLKWPCPPTSTAPLCPPWQAAGSTSSSRSAGRTSRPNSLPRGCLEGDNGSVEKGVLSEPTCDLRHVRQIDATWHICSHRIFDHPLDELASESVSRFNIAQNHFNNPF
jgi:PQQ enzyme repeat